MKRLQVTWGEGEEEEEEEDHCCKTCAFDFQSVKCSETCIVDPLPHEDPPVQTYCKYSSPVILDDTIVMKSE